jgi:hypothetical protein
MRSMEDQTKLRLELAQANVKLTRAAMDEAQKRWLSAMEELDRCERKARPVCTWAAEHHPV